MSPNLYNTLGLILLVCAPAALGQQQFNYTLKLDGKYTLNTEVDLDAKKIQFEAIVETTGWIGLGLSSGPNMMKADIFIGWVPDAENANVTNFGDYYGNETGNTRPIPDTTTASDWNVTSAIKTNNMTTIKFNRMFNVTDAVQDKEIKDENIYLIWAYGELNTTDQLPTPNQHLARGSKSINLTKPPSSAATALNSMSSLAFGAVCVAFSIISRF